LNLTGQQIITFIPFMKTFVIVRQSLCSTIWQKWRS